MRPTQFSPGRYASTALVAIGILFSLAGAAGAAETAESYLKEGIANFKLGDEAAMKKAKRLYEKALKLDNKNYDAAWRLAEVGYYLWEAYAGWDAGRGEKQAYLLETAREGVQAGRLAIKLKPDGVEGLFWLSADLGVWGLTNGVIDSLSQVPHVLKHTERCIELDPQGKFERGGCYRIAGAVYTQLPGFPVSIGDKKRAALYFQKSYIKGGEYGINHNLHAELLLLGGGTDLAIEVLEKNLAMMRGRKPYDYYDRRDMKRAEDLLKLARSKK